MAEPRFQLTDITVEALEAAVTALSADLDTLWKEFSSQPPQWRHSPHGVEIRYRLELAESLCAAIDDIVHTDPGLQTHKEPPATTRVTGGSSRQ